LAIAIIIATSVVGRIGIHCEATVSAVGVKRWSIEIIGMPRSPGAPSMYKQHGYSSGSGIESPKHDEFCF